MCVQKETPQGLNLKCQRHQRAPIVHVDHEAATQIAMAFRLPLPLLFYSHSHSFYSFAVFPPTTFAN